VDPIEGPVLAAAIDQRGLNEAFESGLTRTDRGGTAVDEERAQKADTSPPGWKQASAN